MKAFCNNPSCSFARDGKFIEVSELENSVCPSCGEKTLAPEWADKFHHPDEKRIRKDLTKAKKSVSKAKVKMSKIEPKSPSSKIKSSEEELKNLEFSYASKLKEISTSFKKEKAKKKFDKIDEHIMQGKLDISRVNIEIGEIKKLLAEFKVKTDRNSEK